MAATSTARLALLLSTLWMGCNAGGTPSTPVGTFTAFASDFLGFHDWTSAAATPASTLPPFDASFGVAADGGGLTGDGGVHTLAETVYLNHPPPSGSTTFPVGTIIVKETEEAEPTARKTFAVVKRGGDFNPTGAVNWEWFELQNSANGGVVINWRGYGPPSGSADIYGGDPAVCNHCHLIAAANDDIWSSSLQLTNF